MIWKECFESGSVFYCTQEIIVAVISLFSMIYAVYCCVYFIMIKRKIQFELCPLFIAAVQGISLLLHSIFRNSLTLEFWLYYLQIMNFGILNIMFVIILSYFRRRTTNKFLSLLLILNSVFYTIFYIISVHIMDVDICLSKFEGGNKIWILSLTEQSLNCVISIYYGIQLIRKIKYHQTNVKVQLMNEYVSNEERMLGDKIKQIKLTILVMILTSLFQITLQVLEVRYFQDQFECTNDEQIPKSSLGYIFLLFEDIGKVIPVILLPYIYFTLPIMKGQLIQQSDDIEDITNIFQKEEENDNFESDLFIQSMRESLLSGKDEQSLQHLSLAEK